ncbi:Glycosyl transferase, group 1 [Roseobacter sp. SK209-2-6]|uniref:glycosyltransferase n=1 Tax=Roseobacter sp. SK209-2-6 TaxID=388739 RepID=UPI0000F3C7C2|nr:glycosyltransferase [Roseobacter sp. SK209-2-6]EBA18646.1 Glycosyl transferase, group 1 [Roseobacter sp. SK209-2-6]
MKPNNNASSLLIYAPVPLYLHEGVFYIEKQAINGLRLWSEHFKPVTAMMPLAKGAPPEGWEPIHAHLKDLEGARIEPLPMAYRPDQFLRAFPAAKKRIKKLISQSEYLSFAIGGLFGDWGSVASLLAHRMGRPFAVWTDRVESEVMRYGRHGGTWRSRLRARLYHRPMAHLERAVIRRAHLGLFHGAETFDAYRPYCKNPQLVHDIHLSARDHINTYSLTQKLVELEDSPLRIAYAGRADAMKGPFDWLAVLEQLKVLGVPFEATWLGEGAALPQMDARAKRAGLADRLRLPGFVSCRAKLLEELQRAHIFLFCHKTPESPRCLIEALTSATPLVGYGGAYACDLIAAHGGGHLVKPGDTEALAQRINSLHQDRGELARLISNAALDGDPFTDDHVFEQRSQIIKQFLPRFPCKPEAEAPAWVCPLARSAVG